MAKQVKKPLTIYIAYIECSKYGQYFARLVNARNKRRPIWNTEMYKRKATALKAITNLPILPENITIVDNTK